MKIAKILIYPLFLFVVVFIISEFITKILRLQTEHKPVWQFSNSKQNFMTLDPKRIYRINKNINLINDGEKYRSDEFGFRYNPNHQERSPSKNRIMVVGDSFTFGLGVKDQETFPAILEDLLLKNENDAWVDNLGVWGYGLDQEFIYLRDEAIPSYRPKVIIWNLDFTDIFDSNEACLFKEWNSEYVQLSGRLNTLYFRYRYLKPIYSLYSNIFGQSRLLLHINTLIPDRYTLGCSEKLAKEIYPDKQKFVKKAAYFFSQIKSLLLSYNAKLLLTISLHERYYKLQPYYSDLTLQINDVNKDAQLFMNAATESGVQVIDANSILVQTGNNADPNILGIKDEKDNQNLFLDEQGFNIGWRHLNPAGNAKMAEIVASQLVGQL